jgi:Xaa-Pro aminopeptidase
MPKRVHYHRNGNERQREYDKSSHQGRDPARGLARVRAARHRRRARRPHREGRRVRESYPNVTGYTLGYYSRVPIRSSDFTRCFLPSAEWRLEAGMVFHMYARGVSFSETVLVGDQGAERLTKLDRRLFSKS